MENLGIELLEASRGAQIETMRELLREGADPNAQDNGWTPLLEAATGPPSVITLLTDFGADPNISTSDGYTPLMRAAGHGKSDVVRKLLQAGADIHARDNLGQTALDMATAGGFEEIAGIIRKNLRSQASVLSASHQRARRHRPELSDRGQFVQPVFIASTFRDMHAERDLLRDFVMPQLEERLAHHRILIEPIDLRWGVNTEGKADVHAKMKRILKVCLEEVSRNDPFVIALIGDRYGWIPPKDLFTAAIREAGLNSSIDSCSITELEIRQALLGSTEADKKCFVYFRESPAYESLLKKGELSTEDATNLATEFSTSPQKQIAVRRLENLKRWLRTEYANLITDYTAEWSKKYRRFVGLEEWAESVTDELCAAIKESHASKAEELPQSVEERESIAIFDFVRTQSLRIVGRDNELKLIQGFVDSNEKESRWFCVVGAHGSGRSALLGAAAKPLSENSSIVLLPNFSKLTPISRSPVKMLFRWSLELSRRLGQKYPLLPDSSEEQVEHFFWSLVRETAIHNMVVLLVDGLDQLEAPKGVEHLRWITPTWVENVKIIMSVDFQSSDVLARYGPGKILRLPGLQADVGRQIVAQVCAKYHRKLPEPIVDTLVSKRRSGGALAVEKPHWIHLAAEIMNLIDGDDFARAERHFTGSDEERLSQLLQEVAGNIPPTVSELNEWTLERTRSLYPRKQTTAVIALLSVARRGFRQRDLEKLVPALCGEKWDQADFASVRRALRAHLARSRDGAWRYVDDDFADASRKLLFDGTEGFEQSVHRVVVEHLLAVETFDEFRISELPWHMMALEEPSRLVLYLLKCMRDVDDGHDSTETGAAIRTLAGRLVDTHGGVSWFVNLINTAGLEPKQKIDFCALALSVLDTFVRDKLDLQRRLQFVSAIRTVLEHSISEHPSSWKIQRELTIAHNRVGDVLREVGEIDEAVKAYDSGMRNLMELIDFGAEDAQPVLFDDIVVGHLKLGSALKGVGRFRVALKHINKAVLRVRDANRDASSGDSRLRLATSLNELGDIQVSLRKFADGRQSFVEAQNLLKTVGTEISWIENGDRLAFALEKLGYLELNEQNFLPASKRFAEAKRHHARALTAQPYSLQRIWGLAEISRSLANALWQIDKRQDDALDAFVVAKNLLDKLVEADPQNRKWRMSHVSTCAAINLASANAGKYSRGSMAKTITLINQASVDFGGNDGSEEELVDAALDLAKAYEAANEVTDAESMHRLAIGFAESARANRPESIAAARNLEITHSKLALLFYKHRQWHNARIGYDSVINVVLAELERSEDSRMRSDYVGYLWMRGNALLKLGDMDAADRDFRKCCEELVTLQSQGKPLSPQLQKIARILKDRED